VEARRLGEQRVEQDRRDEAGVPLLERVFVEGPAHEPVALLERRLAEAAGDDDLELRGGVAAHRHGEDPALRAHERHEGVEHVLQLSERRRESRCRVPRGGASASSFGPVAACVSPGRRLHRIPRECEKGRSLGRHRSAALLRAPRLDLEVVERLRPHAEARGARRLARRDGHARRVAALPPRGRGILRDGLPVLPATRATRDQVTDGVRPHPSAPARAMVGGELRLPLLRSPVHRREQVRSHDRGSRAGCSGPLDDAARRPPPGDERACVQLQPPEPRGRWASVSNSRGSSSRSSGFDRRVSTPRDVRSCRSSRRRSREPNWRPRRSLTPWSTARSALAAETSWPGGAARCARLAVCGQSHRGRSGCRPSCCSTSSSCSGGNGFLALLCALGIVIDGVLRLPYQPGARPP